MIHRNHKLTDKGWASMAQLLDREMPASDNGRRRRALLGWLLWLCIPLAALGGWFAHDLLEPQSPQAKPTQYALNSAALANGAQQPGANTYAGGDREQRNWINSYRNWFYQALLGAQPINSNLQATLPLLPVADTKTDVVNSTLLATNLLEVTQLHPSSPEAPATVAAPVVKKVARLKHWSYGPTIGLASERFVALNAGSLGFTVDYRINRHWGLRSGFMYSYMRTTSNSKPVASLKAVEFARATRDFSILDSHGYVVDPVTGNSTHSKKVFVPLDRLNRFEIPINVYAQPFSNCYVFAGPNISYTLSAQAKKAYAVDNVLVTRTYDRTEAAVNELATNAVQPWQWGLQSGIGWKFGELVELDFMYRLNSVKMRTSDNIQFDGGLLTYLPFGKNKLNNVSIFALHGTLFF